MYFFYHYSQYASSIWEKQINKRRKEKYHHMHEHAIAKTCSVIIIGKCFNSSLKNRLLSGHELHLFSGWTFFTVWRLPPCPAGENPLRRYKKCMSSQSAHFRSRQISRWITQDEEKHLWNLNQTDYYSFLHFPLHRTSKVCKWFDINLTLLLARNASYLNIFFLLLVAAFVNILHVHRIVTHHARRKSSRLI